MSDFFDPARWNLTRSAYSLGILKQEDKFEEWLTIRQTPDQKTPHQINHSYSFWKGIACTLVKIPFCVVGAVAALVEMVIRAVFSLIASIGACCNDSWKEPAWNLWTSAVSVDLPNDSMSALVTLGLSISLPFSEIATMLPKIYLACSGK